MKETTSPTRACTSCGLEKPLAAFIQISGPEGRRYGSICAICRSITDREKGSSSPFDEAGTLKLKLRIGAKERVHAEKEQQRQLTTQKDTIREEVKKRDTLSIEKIQQSDKKGLADKERRETYLEARQKQGFLGSKSTTPPQGIQEQKKSAAASSLISDKKRADEQQQTVATNEIESKKSASLDLSVPFIDSQLGELKYHSQAFLSFIAGTSGPIKHTMEQLFGKRNSPSHAPAAQEKNSPSEKKNNDPLTEFIDNTWKPTSRNR